MKGRVMMRALCMVLCLLLADVGVRGQTAPCPPCLHDQMLSRLPDDVRLVVAVNNAAAQRKSAAGRALSSMIGESGAWTETTRAWRALAATLEWTPEKTFDELLGRRVSLVVRSIATDESARWAVLSEVSAGAQRRIRERLSAAPRGAVAGMSVLAIEDGSFELVVGPANESRPDAPSVVLLVPRSSDDMLDALAPVLRIRSAEATPTIAGKSCDVVVVMRGDEQGRSLSLAASSNDSGWDANIVCSAGWLVDKPAERVPSWSDGYFRAIEPGALLAVMSVMGAAHPLENWSLLPESVRKWPAEVTGVLAAGQPGCRSGVVVRSVSPAMRIQPSQPIVSKTAARAALAQPQALPTADLDRSPRFCVSVMTETRDARAALVKGDEAVARFAKLLITGHSEPLIGPAIQLEIPDQGPRALQFGEGLSIHPDIEPAMSRAFGQSPLLSWRTLHSPGSRVDSGWWLASIAPSNLASVGDREIRVLSSGESGVAKPRLSIGLIRPAAIAACIQDVEPGVAGEVPLAKFIESVRWDAWLRDDGQIEGSMNIRLAAPK